MTDEQNMIPKIIRQSLERGQRIIKRDVSEATKVLQEPDPTDFQDIKTRVEKLKNIRVCHDAHAKNYESWYQKYQDAVEKLSEDALDAECPKNDEYYELEMDRAATMGQLGLKIDSLEKDLANESASTSATPKPSEQYPPRSPDTVTRPPDTSNSAPKAPQATQIPAAPLFKSRQISNDGDIEHSTNLRADANPFYTREFYDYECDRDLQGSRLVPRMIDRYADMTDGHQRLSHFSSVKLPKLELQKFNGDPAKWKPFWDKFDRSVGQNHHLAGSDKLSYLQSFLSGEALKLVENLPTTNENYEVAVGTLKKMFGNPTLALEDINARLCDLKPVPAKGLHKLKEFFYDLENLLGALKSLGGDTESQHLISMILRKLPSNLVVSMELVKGPKVEWTIDLLREGIENQIYARGAAVRRAHNSRSESDDPPPSKGTASKGQARSTTEAFYGNDNQGKAPHSGQGFTKGPKGKRNGQRSRYHGCAYCGASHYSDQCDKVTTASARRRILTEKRLCFICLRSDHMSNQCPSEKPCFYCQRIRSHHSSICKNYKDPDSSNNRREQAHQAAEWSCQANQPVKDLTEDNEQARLGINEKTLMKTAIVNVRNPNDPSRSLKVRVFFDSGTSRSFMTVRTANKLRLTKTKHEKLWIDRFDNNDAPPFVIDTATAKVDIQTKDKGFWRISVAICDQTMENMTRKAVPHNVIGALPKGIVLADKPLTKNERVDVDFMIGNDYYDDFIGWSRQGTRPLLNGFWLIDSELGWIISGRLPDNQNDSSLRRENAHLVLTNSDQVDNMDRVLYKESARGEFEKVESQCPGTLADLWDLETLGVKDEPSPPSDDWAIDEFNKTVTKIDNRYYVTFPWKPGTEKIPSNEKLALKKMKNLVGRYKAKNRHELLQQYDAIIKDQLAKGVIEEVKDVATTNRVHFLAHHGVETPWKTTKLRIVYDASARGSPGSPSLNDCMYRGQVFLENLLTLLLRFRCYKIAIVADIEKAFLQVGVQEHERDATRFFWLRDITKEPDKDNIIVYRFQRVSFGITASPFLLGATLMHHLKSYDGPVARKIEENLYVDNVISGVESREEAAKFYRESKSIFAAAGMNLREYGSNDIDFIESLPATDRIDGNNVKVLGMYWDRLTDELGVKGPTEFKPEATKATILAELFKVFDPMGFASPVTIQGKILLQEVTKKKYAWNAPLPDNICRRWHEMSADLCKISELKIPRFVGTYEWSKQRLMVFCDASKLAYATVAYLQSEMSPEVYSSHIVFAKSRVCPIKEMSIPRLELMGLLIGTRAVRTVRRSIKFDGQVIVWSDSTCALQWLTSSKIQGKFVENRVKEILQEKGIEFRYVPTKDNPADRASRGAKYESLDKTWLHGPSWASMAESSWPSLVVSQDSQDGEATDDRKEQDDQAFVVADVVPQSPFDIDPTDYSSFKRLIRVHGWCTRFVHNARKRNKVNTKTLQSQEIKSSCQQWILWIQGTAFKSLIQALNADKPHQLRNNLGVFLDKTGILRCSGRVQAPDLSEDTKNPILLPSKSRLTELIIEDAHTSNLHAGVSQTLSACRLAYWIPKGRQRVREIIGRCLTCKKFDGGPFARPRMPELPKQRVTPNRPFCHVGIDYFGPLMVRGMQECQKRWVCIFACLTTRAIHLEMVEDMSAAEYLLALKRFVSRRAKPETILCDNATHFKAVKETEPFSDYLSSKTIDWKFIPQFGPWAGGVYERLIAIIKNALKKTIGKRLLTSQQLGTLIIEVEYIVNCRPLTYIGDDINDIKILHPNDLIGIPCATIATPNQDNDDPDYIQERGTKAEIKNLYTKNARILEEFWKVWSSDYLLSLRERHTWRHKDPRVRVRRTPQVGEIVLLKEPLRKRNQWDLGRITEAIPSKDGSIRAVKLTLPDRKTTIRPINLLYPIECDIGGNDDQEPLKDKQRAVRDGDTINDKDTNSHKTIPTATDRPKRRAALMASNKIHDILNKEDDSMAE